MSHSFYARGGRPVKAAADATSPRQQHVVVREPLVELATQVAGPEDHLLQALLPERRHVDRPDPAPAFLETLAAPEPAELLTAHGLPALWFLRHECQA